MQRRPTPPNAGSNRPTVCDRLCDRLDRFTERVGRGAAWLILAMAAITFLVVVLRYGANWGSVAIQESVTYLHATVIATCIAYTLRHNDHMRVDIFYQRFSDRTRALIDIFGCVFFLIPVCVVVFAVSVGYAAHSWSILERSSEVGGLPFIFFLKSLIPLMAALLLVQAISHLLRHILRVRRRPPPQQ